MRLIIRLVVLVLASALPGAAPTLAQSPSRSLAQVADTSFRHELHQEFTCLDCHRMRPDHGELLVADVSDCRSCHHVRVRDRGCDACHQAAELARTTVSRDFTFVLSVLEEPAERRVDFSHGVHASRECAECHGGPGPTLAPRVLDCGSCHAEHHRSTASGCMQCHRQPDEAAHTFDVHETCSGSGCHTDPPFAESPSTRTGCLWCHGEMIDHEPGQNCVDCHVLVGVERPAAAAVPASDGLHEEFGVRYLHVPH